MKQNSTTWTATVLGLAIGAASTAVLGCSGEQPKTPEARGRQTYLFVCAACHFAGDPNKDVPLAPAIAGSSLELLRAKVRRNEYPPGYKPQRDTKLMTPGLPVSDQQLEEIAAYLAQAARQKAAKPKGD